ncbi:MAG: AMP-binding protein [Rhodospirillales bacterium]|nr:AMP-binding protein [Rhodospirillales bacterium]
MDIGSLLPRHARYRAEHPALIVGGHSLTYKALNARVNRLAHALLRAGLKKGDKFATVLPNCLELMAAYWAAAKTGLVIVPMSPLLQDGGLASLLKDSDTSLVLGHVSFAATFERLRPRLPHIAAERWILLGTDATQQPAFCTYEAFIGDAPDDNPPDAGIVDADMFNIMYSSGTTGLPKGIIHSHYVRAMYCTLFAQAFRISPESVVLHAGSIVFNGAMVDLMPWMFVGGTYVLHESFDPARVIADTHRYKVTHIIMVPAQITAVLDHPDYTPEKLASLEMLHNLGAPLHVRVKQRINAELPNRFYELYGLTEGFMTILDKHDAIRKLGSVGCPPPFMEIRIEREDGSACAAGEVGEICGRSPCMMPGYYKRPDLSAVAIRDGWLHTGDAGYVDEEGYLFLVDRIKDMIIVGGVNVYPFDVEKVIAGHPAVREVAVFGVQDAKWGEVPIAAVALKPGDRPGREELVAWTNARVDAKFQRIQDVVLYEEFPRNVAGKTLKREMRDAYAKAQVS